MSDVLVLFVEVALYRVFVFDASLRRNDKMAARAGALFADCAFAFVPSNHLTADTINLVRQQIIYPLAVVIASQDC